MTIKGKDLLKQIEKKEKEVLALKKQVDSLEERAFWIAHNQLAEDIQILRCRPNHDIKFSLKEKEYLVVSHTTFEGGVTLNIWDNRKLDRIGSGYPWIYSYNFEQTFKNRNGKEYRKPYSQWDKLKFLKDLEKVGLLEPLIEKIKEKI